MADKKRFVPKFISGLMITGGMFGPTELELHNALSDDSAKELSDILADLKLSIVSLPFNSSPMSPFIFPKVNFFVTQSGVLVNAGLMGMYWVSNSAALAEEYTRKDIAIATS